MTTLNVEELIETVKQKIDYNNILTIPSEVKLPKDIWMSEDPEKRMEDYDNGIYTIKEWAHSQNIISRIKLLLSNPKAEELEGIIKLSFTFLPDNFIKALEEKVKIWVSYFV